ncbi:MAG: cytochrome c [Hyphomicrobiaceae bacterium]
MTPYRTTLAGSLVVALLEAICGYAPGAAGEPETDRLAEAGRRIVEAQCSRCHATGRTGASPLDKAPPFRALSRKYPVSQLAEALAEGITTGHPDMPEFIFPEEDIAAILAYLERIDERKAP